MTSRERVQTALDHREPDSVPIDLAAYQDTTLTLTTYRQLERHYGRKFDGYNLFSWMDGLLYPDDELLKILGVDTRSIFTGKGKHAGLESFYKEVGVKPLADGSLGVYSDDGKLLLFQKPEDAYGFQFKEFPLAGELTREKIDRYFEDPQTDYHLFFGIDRAKASAGQRKSANTKFDPRLAAPICARYDATDLKTLRKKAKWLHENTDYAIVTGNCVGLVVTSMQFVMGYENWYLQLALSPRELVYATEVYLENHLIPFLDKFYDAIGEFIDVAYCVADDMATQLAPSFSVDLYRRYFKPMHKKIIETTRKHTKARIMFHICGAAYPFLADLIEVGVDIINPVQNNAVGMEEERLKRDFGRDLSFWGAVDTQNILSRGTVEQVASEVKRKMEVLGKDGGYVLSPCHDIQRNTPVENVIAMYEAANALRVTS